MKIGGADTLSFDTIVAFGENSAIPHAKPSDRKLKVGDIILIDFGAKCDGYCSDMTRCFVFGECSDAIKRIYNCVLGANEIAIASIRSGMPYAEADRIARNYIIGFGYGECFTHSLGHGVGVDIHEAPYLSSKCNSSEVLIDNMVVTVEPGIYIEGLGGIRIEDMIVVSGARAINLTTSHKKLVIMAYIQAGEFRKGITFEMDGKVMVIAEFLHVKPGKGAAFVRTKIRDVINGGLLDKTFNPTEKFELAHIERKTLEYLYSDGELFYFMDPETFEQTALNEESVSEALMFVKENMKVDIEFFKGKPFSVMPPNFVELLITFCEPGIKGNTSQGVTKPATLETGYILQVPLFVNEGDTVRVDTRNGSYMSRV